MKEITIDLVRAEDGSLWFVNLKSYVVDDNCYRLKQVQTMMKSGELAEERQIQREGASNTGTETGLTRWIAFCKMCGLRLKVGELNKRLTLKMIYHVKGHLERRGIFIYSNLPHQPAETMTDTIKICSTCYSVAIAEYDLIETECKLAQIQGIPATVHTILNDDVGKKSKHSNAIMDPFLFQWRVMIHLESLLDIPAAFLRSTTEYSVQYKVFDYSISFPLTLRENNPFVLSIIPIITHPRPPPVQNLQLRQRHLLLQAHPQDQQTSHLLFLLANVRPGRVPQVGEPQPAYHRGQRLGLACGPGLCQGFCRLHHLRLRQPLR